MCIAVIQQPSAGLWVKLVGILLTEEQEEGFAELGTECGCNGVSYPHPILILVGDGTASAPQVTDDISDRVDVRLAVAGSSLWGRYAVWLMRFLPNSLCWFIDSEELCRLLDN